MSGLGDSNAAVAAIGLGANLERPRAMISAALNGLSALPETRIKSKSRLYLSRPQGGPEGQDWYHNGAVLLITSLEPPVLLRKLLDIETGLGRVRLERWGPRTIDLDLLFYNYEVMDTPELILPHPRMAERVFVLEPLNEVASDWLHPLIGLTIGQMLAEKPCPQRRELKLLGSL